MNWKNIVLGTIIGGVLLTITSFLFNMIANAILPFNMLELAGIRAVSDPLMTLFFVYPFVFALMAAVVFDKVKSLLKGSATQKGMAFGGGLFLVYSIPSAFVVFSSMAYPAGFFVGSILQGLVGFALLGILYAKLWKE